VLNYSISRLAPILVTFRRDADPLDAGVEWKAIEPAFGWPTRWKRQLTVGQPAAACCDNFPDADFWLGTTSGWLESAQ
jgi:hypothetical protein